MGQQFQDNRGEAGARGGLGLTVIRKGQAPLQVVPRDRARGLPAAERLTAEIFWSKLRRGLPVGDLDPAVRRWRTRNLVRLVRGARGILLARGLGVAFFHGSLELVKILPTRERLELGMAGFRVVTTAGVGFIVDAFQNLVEAETMKFHGIGTGGTAEASGDTALVTELTTQYNPDNTRATGNLAEGASANIFHTEGTNTVDASAGITEHGVFTQAATGGGTLLDRTLFSVVNLASGDGLLSKYEITFTAGG